MNSAGHVNLREKDKRGLVTGTRKKAFMYKMLVIRTVNYVKKLTSLSKAIYSFLCMCQTFMFEEEHLRFLLGVHSVLHWGINPINSQIYTWVTYQQQRLKFLFFSLDLLCRAYSHSTYGRLQQHLFGLVLYICHNFRVFSCWRHRRLTKRAPLNLTMYFHAMGLKAQYLRNFFIPPFIYRHGWIARKS